MILKLFPSCLIIRIVLLFLMVSAKVCIAQTIVIQGKTVIDKPMTYHHVTLDMSHGSFVITNNATLDIENSEINGTLAVDNPFLINVNNGTLKLKNNTVNVTAVGIQAARDSVSLYNTITVFQGAVEIIANHFTIDKPYTAGLFFTGSVPTSNLIIKGNSIHNFHGGVYLSHSVHATVSNNRFSNVSIGNIYSESGTNSVFKKNVILFPGNNNVGDGIDVINSDNTVINNNYISSGSCYSIVIMQSQHVLINRNQIIGGITYAIHVIPGIDASDVYSHYLLNTVKSANTGDQHYKNSHITISHNYLAENRFGLSVSHVDNLVVEGNVFIQRFQNAKNRRFWTNNDILLKDNTHITWKNNRYKEAFVQTVTGSNAQSLKFVEFPLQGGIVL